MVQLVDPQSNRRNNEKQGKLDGDRERQDEFIDAVDGK